MLLLIEEQLEVSAFLRAQDQLSFALRVERDLTKVFVLSAASFFEHRIMTAIESMAERVQDERIITFVRVKALKRQYHSYFKWDDKSLGPFRTLFGDAFGGALKKKEKAEPEFKKAVDAFLKIGNERNLLVHENFATYPMGGTLAEWRTNYERAVVFVAYVEDAMGQAAPEPEDA